MKKKNQMIKVWSNQYHFEQTKQESVQYKTLGPELSWVAVLSYINRITKKQG